MILHLLVSSSRVCETNFVGLADFFLENYSYLDIFAHAHCTVNRTEQIHCKDERSERYYEL